MKDKKAAGFIGLLKAYIGITDRAMRAEIVIRK
jgi:hypothetical protein